MAASRAASVPRGVALVGTLGNWRVRAEQRIADHRPTTVPIAIASASIGFSLFSCLTIQIRGGYGARHSEMGEPSPGSLRIIIDIARRPNSRRLA